MVGDEVMAVTKQMYESKKVLELECALDGARQREQRLSSQLRQAKEKIAWYQRQLAEAELRIWLLKKRKWWEFWK